MSVIQERNFRLELGLKKQYKLIHASDVHMIYPVSDLDKDRDAHFWMEGKKGFAEHFGEAYSEEQMIPSAQIFDAFIDYVNSESPDCFVMTGDIIDYYTPDTYSYLVKGLARLTCPFIYTIGNHELPEHNFNDMLGDKRDFCVHDLGEFEIVCVNDARRSFSEEQYSLLLKETQKNKPIIMAFHIPLYTPMCVKKLKNRDNYYYIDHDDTDEVTLKTFDLILNDKNIRAVLCGHIHGELSTFITENKPEITCSSGLIGRINKIAVV